MTSGLPLIRARAQEAGRLDVDADTLAYMERVFAPPALERLAYSTQDYYSTHGEYIVPLAKLLLIAYAERDVLCDIAEAAAPFADPSNWAHNFDGAGLVYTGPESNAIHGVVTVPGELRAALSRLEAV